MLDTASLIELLAQPKKIVITTHHKPDGDAMGSSLGLYNYLNTAGPSCQSYCALPIIPPFLSLAAR